MGYSFRLAARVILYAPSHRQDSKYHGLCYTSREALAGTRNSSMDPPWRIDPKTHRTMSERSYHGATSRSHDRRGHDTRYIGDTSKDTTRRYSESVQVIVDSTSISIKWTSFIHINCPCSTRSCCSRTCMITSTMTYIKPLTPSLLWYFFLHILPRKRKVISNVWMPAIHFLWLNLLIAYSLKYNLKK